MSKISLCPIEGIEDALIDPPLERGRSKINLPIAHVPSDEFPSVPSFVEALRWREITIEPEWWVDGREPTDKDDSFLLSHDRAIFEGSYMLNNPAEDTVPQYSQGMGDGACKHSSVGGGGQPFCIFSLWSLDASVPIPRVLVGKAHVPEHATIFTPNSIYGVTRPIKLGEPLKWLPGVFMEIANYD